MASFTYKSGNALIQWVDAHGKRGTLRLSGIDRRGAEQVRVHVERLVGAKIANSPPPLVTSAWLGEVGDKLHSRLVKVGLAAPRAGAEPRPVTELGKFIRGYIEKRTDLKRSSVANLIQVEKHLLKHFGARQDITLINRGDMRDWHVFIKSKLAGPTVAKHVKKARQMFQDAVDRKLITENPVKGIKAGAQDNTARMVYVPAATIEDVIAACPDHEWKLIFAMARYAGVRVPSETLTLRWSDVHWDKARMIVRSPKTQDQGKAQRTVPLFPELLPYLLDAFENATPGDDRVIVLHRGENLRTTADKIINRAGLAVWPKPFQNLRSSRETDLADVYPIHVVCAWIGNSELVARKHYLQVKEEHMEKAAGRAARGAAETAGNERKGEPENKKNPQKSGISEEFTGPCGTRTVSDFREFLQGQEKALHGALHRLKSSLPRLRRRDIRRLERAVKYARRRIGGGR